jgi:hypothetical protein
MISLAVYEKRLHEKVAFDKLKQAEIDQIFNNVTKKDMRAKRTDREPRKIPGVPPRPPTNWRKTDQVYDPQEAKKNRINFESDIKAIEKELLMQKDQLLER